MAHDAVWMWGQKLVLVYIAISFDSYYPLFFQRLVFRKAETPRVEHPGTQQQDSILKL